MIEKWSLKYCNPPSAFKDSFSIVLAGSIIRDYFLSFMISSSFSTTPLVDLVDFFFLERKIFCLYLVQLHTQTFLYFPLLFLFPHLPRVTFRTWIWKSNPPS